jgi:membrane protease YdiL (CAAX protease family)
MSRARRFWMFPLTRLVVAAAVFVVPPLGYMLAADALGYDASDVLASALSAASALLALYVVGVVIERRSLAELGIAPRGAAAQIGRGFLLGAAVFSSVIAIQSLAGLAHIAWVPSPPIGAVAAAFLVFLCVGISEEVAVRGLFFRIVEDGLGSWAALALSALLFGALHLGNPNATLWAGAAIAIEAGLLLAAFYMLTRSLVFVIALHWAWNFFEGPIFGTAVSGTHSEGLLHTTTSGPDAWTGGAFGPEASVVAVLVCGVVTVVALALAVRRGQVRAPSWRRPAA